MKTRRMIMPSICACALAALTACAGDGSDGTPALNTYSYWRLHVTLRPVPFGTAEKAGPDEKGGIAINSRYRKPSLPINRPDTPFPPSDWTRPEFDDARWWRDPGPFFGSVGEGTYGSIRPHENRWGVRQASTIALLCLRGKFGVTDPVAVKDLRLSMEFRGGAVVYLNGGEVARFHMKDGPLDPLTLARDYPLEATMKGGKVHDATRGDKDLLDLRVRKADRVELPAAKLRKGTNVLAIEIHRAAMPVEVLDCNRKEVGGNRGWFWNTVGLMSVDLTAGGAGVVPSVERPAGLQIWNANPAESIYVTDYGDPNEELRPIRIVAARNGAFSGQAIIGSCSPLKGLTASVSALKQAGGAGEIPASAVEILWPRPTIASELVPKAPHPVSSRAKGSSVDRFEALLPDPPAEAPVRKGGGRPGAVQPVWLKVNVPADAAPGTYAGTLTIGVAGAPARHVPVALDVHGYRLPDPKDFAVWIDFVQIPESLAAYYKTPLWSERHWALIAQSLKYAAGIGNKTLYIPLIARTNSGNTESMVRWVKRGDGFTHDFSLVEKYLDTALAAGLDPEVVCFQVWDYHVGANTAKGITDETAYNVGPQSWKLGTGKYGQMEVTSQQAVPVSLLDPASGQVTEHAGPTYDDDAAGRFWAPVAAGILKIVRKRGLEKSLMMGLAGDYVPTKRTMNLWNTLLPGAPWVTMAHGRVGKLFDIPVGYATTVFGARYALDPEIERLYGWSRPERVAYFPRYGHKTFLPPAFERIAFEKGISGDMCGMGRQALDDFAELSRGKSGGPSTSWGSLTLAPAWLVPAENGPATSIRFENGRENIQECEARIFIEKALLDQAQRAKLGEERCAMYQTICDERTRAVILADEKGENQLMHTSMPGGPLGLDWFAGSDWQSRASALYDAAAELAAVAGR